MRVATDTTAEVQLGNSLGAVGTHECSGHDRRGGATALHETSWESVAGSPGRKTPVEGIPNNRKAMHTSCKEAGVGQGVKAIGTRHPTNSDPSGFGGLSRSALMSRVRSRGNKTTELRMVALLRQYGIAGWRRHTKLPGNPDFVWSKLHVALFVDGCFWHGHQCGRNLTPENNAELWEKKFAATRLRDAANARNLRKRGWVVVRVWECALKRAPETCVRRIQSALKA